jgi:hypothetical protein
MTFQPPPPPPGQPPQGPPSGGYGGEPPQGPPGGYGQPPQGPPPGGYGPPPQGPPPSYGQPLQGGYPPGPPPGVQPPPGGFGPPPPQAGYGQPAQGQWGPPPGQHGRAGAGTSFDPKSVNPLDWGLLAAGPLAFIFSLFSWYTYSLGPYDASLNAWHGFFGWFAVLLALVGSAALALSSSCPCRTGSSRSAPSPWRCCA